MSSLTLFARNERQLLLGYDGDAISQLIAVDRDATIAEIVDELELSTGEFLEVLDNAGFSFSRSLDLDSTFSAVVEEGSA